MKEAQLHQLFDTGPGAAPGPDMSGLSLTATPALPPAAVTVLVMLVRSLPLDRTEYSVADISAATGMPIGDLRPIIVALHRVSIRAARATSDVSGWVRSGSPIEALRGDEMIFSASTMTLLRKLDADGVDLFGALWTPGNEGTGA